MFIFQYFEVSNSLWEPLNGSDNVLFLFIFNFHVFVNFPKSHLLLFSTFGYSSITIHAWFLESYILKTLVIDWMFDVSLKTCVNWESGCVALLL